MKAVPLPAPLLEGGKPLRGRLRKLQGEALKRGLKEGLREA